MQELEVQQVLAYLTGFRTHYKRHKKDHLKKENTKEIFAGEETLGTAWCETGVGWNQAGEEHQEHMRDTEH